MTERLHFHFSLSCIGEGNGNPLQCSCLENPRDRGAWWAAVSGVAQCRDTTEATLQQQQQQGTRKKPYYINRNIKWHYGEYDSICIPEMKSTYKLLL